MSNGEDHYKGGHFYCDSGEEYLDGIYFFPVFELDKGIADVEKVVGYEKGFIELVCEGGISRKKGMDKDAAVCEKPLTYINDDEDHHGEINNIGENIIGHGLWCFLRT